MDKYIQAFWSKLDKQISSSFQKYLQQLQILIKRETIYKNEEF